jgi:hypothetical protein
MALYICRNCGAKFAKLEKLYCQTCSEYKCPACKLCYCQYDSKKIDNNIIENLLRIEEEPKESIPIFATIEYAKYLLNKQNLQMKGYLEYVGQRNIVSLKKTFLISDFLFYDKTGVLPLRIFGPVPQNYFKYRFAMNRVFLEGVSIRLFQGSFELVLNSKGKGKITILKEKQSQSLFKFISSESEKART